MIGVCGKVLSGVVVTAEHMEAVTVDSYVSSDGKVRWSDELHSAVDVLVFVPLEEWTLKEAGVLLSWFEHGDGVVGQVERDDESSVHVFGYLCVESGGVSEDLPVVVHVLEEVNLGLLGNQVIDVAERVHFVTKSIVRGDLHLHWVGWLWLLDVADGELSVEFLVEVLLRESVHTSDFEHSAVGNQWSVVSDFITGQVSVSDEVLTWLFHIEGLWKLLSSKVHREGVSSVVGKVHFSDLDGVVSQEVVPEELESL